MPPQRSPRILLAVALLAVAASVPARAEIFRLPLGDDAVGMVSEYTVETDDDVYEVARDFRLGLIELMAANPTVSEWMPQEDTVIQLPRAHVLPEVKRQGVVINLAEQRLYYFHAPDAVMTFPIGIGKEGWQTPLGQTMVVNKREHPIWIPPASIKAENPKFSAPVPPGPDNPLGDYALDLSWPRFLIHGTNAPWGIGSRSSHGCIRMYPEDIKTLFEHVAVGTPVTVIDTPFKLGWRGKDLLLEVTPSQAQADDIEQQRATTPLPIPNLYDAVRRKAFSKAVVAIDWELVNAAVADRTGLPVVVARKEDPVIYQVTDPGDEQTIQLPLAEDE